MSVVPILLFFVRCCRFFPRAGVAVVAAVLTVAPAWVAAQERVTFFVSVTTPGGEPVADLRAEDLAVLEDGRAGRVLEVTRVRRPVKVTVLVDNGANTEPLLLIYRNGLRTLFAGLPPGVEASLLTLAPQPRWLVRPTRDREELMAGVDRLTTDSAAARLADGLIEAAARIEQDHAKQAGYFPVIVVVSTTGPEGSRPGDRDLQRMARQLDAHAARVHVIMLSTGGTSANEVLGAPQVHVAKFVADQTAGRYDAIAAATHIPTALAEYARMIGDAHAFQSDQYVVTAELPPAAAGAARKRAVKLSRTGVVFTVTADGLLP